MKAVDADTYLKALLAAPRPGSEQVLAFYDHRVGHICTDASLLLLPLDDHICHRGDGLFESISYRQGRLFSLDQHLAETERNFIEAALQLAHGNVSQAARLLGINRTTLYNRMESFARGQ